LRHEPLRQHNIAPRQHDVRGAVFQNNNIEWLSLTQLAELSGVGLIAEQARRAGIIDKTKNLVN